MQTFDTLVEALNALRTEGYIHDFNIDGNCLECKTENLKLNANEFEVAHVYRFEGETDPADQTILYAIESHHGLKGTLVNAYGVYAEDIAADLVSKLTIQR